MPSHGSLTKSGKVRQMSGKRQWRIEKNVKKWHKKKHKHPRTKNRRKYEIMLLKKKEMFIFS